MVDCILLSAAIHSADEKSPAFAPSAGLLTWKLSSLRSLTKTFVIGSHHNWEILLAYLHLPSGRDSLELVIPPLMAQTNQFRKNIDPCWLWTGFLNYMQPERRMLAGRWSVWSTLKWCSRKTWMSGTTTPAIEAIDWKRWSEGPVYAGVQDGMANLQ